MACKLILSVLGDQTALLPMAPFDELCSRMRSHHHLRASDSFDLHYFDDEGDEIRVTSDEELIEALRDTSAVRLFLTVSQAQQEKPQKQQQQQQARRASKIEVLSPRRSSQIAIESSGSKRQAPRQSQPEIVVPKESPEYWRRMGFVPIDKQQRAATIVCSSPSRLTVAIGSAQSDKASGLSRIAVQSPRTAPRVVEGMPKASPRPAHDARCDGCNQRIIGIRYKCANCSDYDLCESCEGQNVEGQVHTRDHAFLKLSRPISNFNARPLVAAELFEAEAAAQSNDTEAAKQTRSRSIPIVRTLSPQERLEILEAELKDLEKDVVVERRRLSVSCSPPTSHLESSSPARVAVGTPAREEAPRRRSVSIAVVGTPIPARQNARQPSPESPATPSRVPIATTSRAVIVPLSPAVSGQRIPISATVEEPQPLTNVEPTTESAVEIFSVSESEPQVQISAEEALYSTQLATLLAMGFDKSAALNSLVATAGNVEQAIDRLFQ